MFECKRISDGNSRIHQSRTPIDAGAVEIRESILGVILKK